MTATAERQMELTLPMVPDIEIAAARAAAISPASTRVAPTVASM
jgi:hypothetical protein